MTLRNLLGASRRPRFQWGGGVAPGGPLMEFGQGRGDGLIPIRTAGEAEAQQQEGGESHRRA